MIKPDHKRWARSLFNPYIKRLLRKNFSHFYLVNEPVIEDGKGLMVTPNHFSWWDGFFIEFAIRQFTNRLLHIMMLEEQLNRFWFFRKLGAYSINLNNSKSIAESLRYTQEILKNHSNYVVYYPQGAIQPYDLKPVNIKPGLQKIFQDVDINANVIPAAFKIQYGEEPLPDIYARFAKPLEGSAVGHTPDVFKEAFCENIHHLDRSAHKQRYIIDLFNTNKNT